MSLEMASNPLILRLRLETVRKLVQLSTFSPFSRTVRKVLMGVSHLFESPPFQLPPSP